MIKEHWVVENLDSKGFFLEYNYMGGRVGFASDIQKCSHYDSIGMAQLMVDRIKRDGYSFNLQIKQLKISYQLS